MGEGDVSDGFDGGFGGRRVVAGGSGGGGFGVGEVVDEAVEVRAVEEEVVVGGGGGGEVEGCGIIDEIVDGGCGRDLVI